MKPTFKRLLSGVLSMTMLMSVVPSVSVFAEDTSEYYPYTLFASSTDEGAITVNAGNFCVNGNVAVNGTISSSGNMNINGVREEEAGLEMLYIFNRLDTTYFSSDNVEVHEEDYTLEEMNININSPLEIVGEAELTGNININSALKAFKNVELYGEVKNTNDSVIYSKYGDIIIDSANVNLNGLVYAPFGNVIVTAQNLNLNNVVIIANTITLNCPNVNANYSSSAAELVGTASEPLDIPVEEWAYMKDENENDFPDFFEDMGNWSKLKDSDGDKLPDCVEQYIETNSLNCDTDGDGLDDYYELMILGTDPTLVDTDENGIVDGDGDFDEDGLINYEEYNRNTDPWNPDSDADNLLDGDEVNIYHTDPLDKDSDDDGLDDDDEIQLKTDPLNPDSDGNTILDGEEKYPQTFEHKVLNDCTVDKVVVSMVGTGNLQKTTSVDSIMDEDILCSDVVGLVGEPFEIMSTSEFDAESNPATITFHINQDKLGETSFEDLLFLWYDEENYKFVELETIHDFENSCVSINTTHFSKYMLVDQKSWFEAWAVEFNYRPENDSYTQFSYDTIIAIDCSGSMGDYDTTGIESKRAQAVTNFLETMKENDRAGIITFNSDADVATSLTNSIIDLKNGLTTITSSRGTNFDVAINTALDEFDNNDTTIKQIILLSDGEDAIPYDALDKCNERYITVYTVGLGNSSDYILKEIATYTGGKFFKAYTADELLKIYSTIGFYNDFDTTDTDGDGLYDAVESVGIRIQNGNIIYDCNPLLLDSDNDGLTDGQEIEPTICWKSETFLAGATSPAYYFTMKSSPVIVDTDNDGYPDISDIDIFNYNDYSFLDNEIYTIGQLDEQVEAKDLYLNAPITMTSADEINSQKFKFKWCGTGYKIYPLDGEITNKVITVNSSYDIIIANDINAPEQLWEILPRFFEDPTAEYSSGLIFRSKVMDSTTLLSKPLYLKSYSGTLRLSTDKDDNTRFKLYSPNNWTRFGEAYLNCYGWEYTGISNGMVSFDNYYWNTSKNLDSTNIFPETKTDIFGASITKKYVLYQNGGNFPELKYFATKMSSTGCGIIATYNAMIAADVEVDFFKLALEFEYNAIYSLPFIGKFIPYGSTGSDRYKIKDCLDAYNISYVMYDSKSTSTANSICNSFNSDLLTGKSGIIYYKFPILAHFFAAQYDSSNLTAPIRTFNYFGSSMKPDNFTSIRNAFISAKAEGIFVTGYVIK